MPDATIDGNLIQLFDENALKDYDYMHVIIKTNKGKTMEKKLIQLIDLDKIQAVWDHYLEKRNLGQEDSLIEGLSKLERCILEALVEDFKKQVDYY